MSIEAVEGGPLMMGLDPKYSTSTTSDLTDLTRRKADDEWEAQHLAAGQEAGPFYRIQDDGEWEPNRDSPVGRWAGTTMPSSKANAAELYHLGHLDKAKSWYVFTFVISSGQPCEYFISRVKNGSGIQIKIPNQACSYIQFKDTRLLPDVMG